MINSRQVKSKLNIPLDNTDYDAVIEWNITTYEPIVIVDFFGTADVLNKFTADQRIRLELGLITYIAGKTMEGIVSGNTTDFSGSIGVGPISLGEGNSGKVSANRAIAKSLITEGTELLETLRVYLSVNPDWGAV